jgi:hypothetical protein
LSLPNIVDMQLLLPRILIAILAFTFWTNTLASGCLTSLNRVDKPASSNNSDAQDSTPSGWRKIDVDGKFSFYLPPDMRDTGVRGIENLHREYSNGRMHLSFDYKPFGYLSYERRELKFGKGFQETELQIDNRKSFLFLYQDVDWKKRRTHDADLYVGDLPKGDVILRMWMTSSSPRDVETAKSIFQTIKFPSP